MKLIINIDEAIYEEAKNNWNYLPLFHCEEIWKATADGTPIPDDATNGEVLQKVFGCDHSFNIYHAAEIAVGLDGNTEFTISWWNAPYKSESESGK